MPHSANYAIFTNLQLAKVAEILDIFVIPSDISVYNL
jgi:hypothetical protein